MDLIPLARQVGEALLHRNWKLVSAESCTGGGVAYYTTAIPGSSQWFDSSFVTYQNSAKQQMLGIAPTLLEKFGAVSESVARHMAENALARSNAQVSVAITGIAGPTSDNLQKPVGTVWIANCGINLPTTAQHYLFTGNRLQIREQAIKAAFNQLLTILQ